MGFRVRRRGRSVKRAAFGLHFVWRWPKLKASPSGPPLTARSKISRTLLFTKWHIWLMWWVSTNVIQSGLELCIIDWNGFIMKSPGEGENTSRCQRTWPLIVFFWTNRNGSTNWLNARGYRACMDVKTLLNPWPFLWKLVREVFAHQQRLKNFSQTGIFRCLIVKNLIYNRSIKHWNYMLLASTMMLWRSLIVYWRKEGWQHFIAFEPCFGRIKENTKKGLRTWHSRSKLFNIRRTNWVWFMGAGRKCMNSIVTEIVPLRIWIVQCRSTPRCTSIREWLELRCFIDIRNMMQRLNNWPR